MPGPDIVRRNFRQYDKDNGWAGMLAPSGQGWAVSSVTVVASTAFLARFVPSRNMTIVNMTFSVTTAASLDDACDVGIYDATLANKLVSAGATAGKLNATGIKTIPVTATTLKAGTVYFAAFSVGTIGGTAAILSGAGVGSANVAQFFGTTVPNLMAGTKGTSHPLPASIATPAASSLPVCLALQET